MSAIPLFVVEEGGEPSIRLNEAAISELPALSKRHAVRRLELVPIMGPARSGKSFLLNQLAGEPDLFSVSGGAVACTKGAYLSPRPLLSGEAADAVGAVLVDVEGQGSRSEPWDAMVGAPLLLSARAVIYNHRGPVAVHDILLRLGIIARVADYARVELDPRYEGATSAEVLSRRREIEAKIRRGGGDGAEGKAEDGGGSESGSNLPAAVPRCLNVVLRDYSLGATADEVTQALLQPEADGAGEAGGGKGGSDRAGHSARAQQTGRQPNGGVAERNAIRTLLARTFQEIRVWPFPPPAPAEELARHQSLPQSAVSPAFARCAEALRVAILLQCARASGTEGQPAEAADRGEPPWRLLERSVAALNRAGAPDVASSFEHHSAAIVARQMRALEAAYVRSQERAGYAPSLFDVSSRHREGGGAADAVPAAAAAEGQVGEGEGDGEGEGEGGDSLIDLSGVGVDDAMDEGSGSGSGSGPGLPLETATREALVAEVRRLGQMVRKLSAELRERGKGDSSAS